MVEAGGEVVQAGVEVGVFAFFCGGEGEGEGLAGEGWAVRRDVGEAEGEEGACWEVFVSGLDLGEGAVGWGVTFVVVGPDVEVEGWRW